jgi:hypothetical protein
MTEALLEGEAEVLLRAAISRALEGDSVALRLCLDRISPRLRPRDDAIDFDLPPVNAVADLLPALRLWTNVFRYLVTTSIWKFF